MKVFKITKGTEFYGIYAETQELAIEYYNEEVGEDTYDSIKEIPESEWHIQNIHEYEDNDTSTEPFLVSINDVICGEETQLVFSNNYDLF